MSCLRTQHNVPGQGSNPDRSIGSRAQKPRSTASPQTFAYVSTNRCEREENGCINFRKHWRKKIPLIYLDYKNSNSLCSPHHNVNSFSCPAVSLSSCRSTTFSDRVLTGRLVIVALCRLLDQKLLLKSCFSNSFTYCFYTVKK